MEPLKLAASRFALAQTTEDRDPAQVAREPQSLEDWEMVLVGGGEDHSSWP